MRKIKFLIIILIISFLFPSNSNCGDNEEIVTLILKCEKLMNKIKILRKKRHKVRRRLNKKSRQVAVMKENQNFEPADVKLTKFLRGMRKDASIMREYGRKIIELKRKLRKTFHKVRNNLQNMKDDSKKEELIKRIRKDREEFRMGRNSSKRLIRISRRILRRLKKFHNNEEFKKILIHRIDEIIGKISFRIDSDKSTENMKQLLILKDKLVRAKDELMKNNH